MESAESELIQALLRIFTQAQLEQIASCAEQVLVAGFGEVTITFQNGHPRFIQSTISKELAIPEKAA